jgi:hypothetical protein
MDFATINQFENPFSQLTTVFSADLEAFVDAFADFAIVIPPYIRPPPKTSHTKLPLNTSNVSATDEMSKNDKTSIKSVDIFNMQLLFTLDILDIIKN